MGRASRKGPLHGVLALTLERVERNIPSEIHKARIPALCWINIYQRTSLDFQSKTSVVLSYQSPLLVVDNITVSENAGVQ